MAVVQPLPVMSYLLPRTVTTVLLTVAPEIGPLLDRNAALRGTTAVDTLLRCCVTHHLRMIALAPKSQIRIRAFVRILSPLVTSYSS